MRTLLFGGPGGAGTTTLATATAVAAARAGRRVVLVSRQVPDIAGLDEVSGLTLVRVEPQAALERWWERHVPAVTAALPLLSVPPASSVVALPGMADLAVLAALGEVEADVVVVDAGPVESATGLLAVPATLRWWLEHLLPPRLRVLGALRAAAVEAQSEARSAVDTVLAAVPALEQALERLALGDPRVTSVVLVVPPRRSAPAVLRSAATALGVHGQRPAAVVVRTLPEEAGPWFAPRREEQDAVLAELTAVAPLVRVPEQASAPADVSALADLTVELAEPPQRAPAVPAPEQIPGGWRLSLSLPFAERGAVDLTRWGDELVLTAAGRRRAVRLDSLLRRCSVTGATLVDAGSAGARLEVGFVPDPQQWPVDLLHSHARAAEEEGAPPGADTEEDE